MEKNMKLVKLCVDVMVPISIIKYNGIVVKRYGSSDYYTKNQYYNEGVLFALNQDITGYAARGLPDPTMCKSITQFKDFETSCASVYPAGEEYSIVDNGYPIVGKLLIRHFIHKNENYMLVCPIAFMSETPLYIVEYAGEYKVYKMTDAFHFPEEMICGTFDLENTVVDDGAC